MTEQLTSEQLQAEFLDVLGKRLRVGGVEYGDDSFHQPLPETAEEMLAELVDVAGWAFVGWVRLRMILKRVALVEPTAGAEPDA